MVSARFSMTLSSSPLPHAVRIKEPNNSDNLTGNVIFSYLIKPYYNNLNS